MFHFVVGSTSQHLTSTA